ncbi:neutral zinc metallopeptidase [Halomonas binhaiensis]|uniref:Neutral zinc metallopeptidase n=1 Tax=Halomonas binhaiensis TaxID=2562282 RepID=A0A5C1NH91_9GAMM|nr:neutral zinc metallopeptidase [Halomonas binhaiensis]QEM81545.1 neutral zinc metallopeptidase [Halomonas binhaiensis]
MRWQGRRRSQNVEDRRGERLAAGTGGGAIMLVLRFLPMLLRSKGGRIILGLGVVAYFGARLMGIDLLSLGQQDTASVDPNSLTQGQQEQVEFVSVVLGDTEEAWNNIFAEQGQTYEEPTLVLFTGAVRSACGTANSAVGPFYCPGDRKLYLDLSFFEEMKRGLGAPGDFAQAYVIAHEVGHHVQTLLGISQQVREAGAGRSQADVNALSVRQELQADCFAGIWGHSANLDRQMLDSGDLEEALNAASAIGDDRLQQQAGKAVVPDSFTHGSSAQRVEWFKRGFESGSLEACNTFGSDL